MTNKPGLVEIEAARDAFNLIVLKAPGYDWNADPLFLTLKTGMIHSVLSALIVAYRSRVQVAWGCSECGWLSSWPCGEAKTVQTAQHYHDTRSWENDNCRAAVRPLVEG